MLSKCANPACSAKLRYLHEGKIFRLDASLPNGKHHGEGNPAEGGSAQIVVRALEAPPATGTHSGDMRREYFWLCGLCAEEMTLAVSQGSVVLTALKKPVAMAPASAENLARQAAAS
jgi:hypothetical protein